MKTNNNIILDIYSHLKKAFGPQSWWPGDTHEEIIIGAILTQNTAWTNVEKATKNLKQCNLLNFQNLFHSNQKRISTLIKPSGYHNQKTKKLLIFAAHLNDKYNFEIDHFLAQPQEKLRDELLTIWGIGPETADSILLYAAQRPSFVIDAYTKRVFSHHNILPTKDTYAHWKALFENALPSDTLLFNEYHALIVCLAKQFCLTKPQCKECPLKYLLGRKEGKEVE